MSSDYRTIVIRTPDDDSAKACIQTALKMLEPYCTAMSLEDEMSVLDLIEEHEDFEDYIAEEARASVKMLHAAAEAR